MRMLNKPHGMFEVRNTAGKTAWEMHIGNRRRRITKENHLKKSGRGLAKVCV